MQTGDMSRCRGILARMRNTSGVRCAAMFVVSRMLGGKQEWGDSRSRRCSANAQYPIRRAAPRVSSSSRRGSGNGLSTGVLGSVGDAYRRSEMRRYPVFRSRSILLVLLIGLAPLSGCSFLGMRAPGANYEPAQGPPNCSERRVLPALDLAGGITGLGVAGLVVMTEALFSAVAGGCDGSGSCSGEHGTSATIGVASLILVASSIYGFSVAQSCNRAHGRYRASSGPRRLGQRTLQSGHESW
jgi:hypothetical protein